MTKVRSGSKPSKWGRRGLVIAALLAASLVGTRSMGELVNGRTRPVQPTPAATRVVQPMPAAREPVAATRPPAAPSTRPAAVTQEEAQSVVRAWFDALGAGDYRGAEGRTSGDASARTRQLAEAIQSEAGQRGVQARLAVRRLDLAAGPAAGEAQAVRANFDVEALAQVGPVAVPVQRLQGQATYLVRRVDGEARIADIQDVAGLPVQ